MKVGWSDFVKKGLKQCPDDNYSGYYRAVGWSDFVKKGFGLRPSNWRVFTEI